MKTTNESKTITTSTRPLSATQINAVIERLKEKYTPMVRKLRDRAEEEWSKARRDQLVKLIRSGRATVEQAERMAEIIKGYNIPGLKREEQESSISESDVKVMLGDLRFELVMANAETYQAIMKKADERFAQLTKK